MHKPCCVALLLLASCKGCDDKPYVPYHIGDEAGAAQLGDPLAVEAGSKSALAPGASIEAPPGSTSWSEHGLELKAPAGTSFTRGLFQDFDGDGKDDALVVLRREGGQNAALAMFASKSGAAPIAHVLTETKLQGDAACSLSSRLDPAGARSALVEIALACAGRTVGDASRHLYLLTQRGEQMTVRAAAELLDPPDVLTVEGNADDRDGDTQPDVTLTFRVTRAGGKSRPLSVVWLDRPAGLSRDLAEPEASLLTLASEAETRAKSSKDARAAVDLAADVLSLARVLCGPSPRVRFEKPSLACGESKALERTAMAKLRAFVTLKEPHFALPAFDEGRAWFKDSKEAQKLALSVVSSVPIADVHTVAAVPEPLPNAPAYGPLTFEPEGSLVVKTQGALVRVDTKSWEESEAPGMRYLATVASPDGAYSWLEAYDPCDGVALRATLAPITVGDVVDVPLPIAASLGKCGDKGDPKRGVPLGWTKSALDVLIEGYPVRIDVARKKAELAMPDFNAPQAPGSARSPNGRVYVVPTSLGLLIGGTGKLLTHADLGKPEQLQGCTTANDGAMAACVRGGKAVVFKP